MKPFAGTCNQVAASDRRAHHLATDAAVAARGHFQHLKALMITAEPISTKASHRVVVQGLELA